jgi:hypothetical protein
MNTILYLVHGTWPFGLWPRSWRIRKGVGREPQWFQEGSEFRKDIERQLSPRTVQFVEVKWGGRNTVRSRSEGAVQLAGKLKEGIEREPGARHVVVAHSHGGNVAMYALQKLDRQYYPAGIVTMATPFLEVEGRPSSDPAGNFLSIIEYLFSIIWILISVILYMFASIILVMNSTKNTILISYILFLVGGALLIRYGMAPYSWLTDRYDMIARGATEALTTRRARGFYPVGTNLLVLRAPGDEATLALASAGFFAWMSSLLWLFITNSFSHVGKVGALYKELDISLLPLPGHPRYNEEIMNRISTTMRETSLISRIVYKGIIIIL